MNLTVDGKDGIYNHLESFKKDYARNKKFCAVFHFATKMSMQPVVADGSLYTLVKTRKELYLPSDFTLQHIQWIV